MKTVSIIGIGRLGLCTALILERSGYDVVGVDIFPQYVDQINRRELTSLEPQVADYLKETKNFRATCDLDESIAHSNLLFICVDTPSTGGERIYDHSKLSRVLGQLGDRKVKDKIVVTQCTVIPGYHAEVASYLLKDCPGTTISYNPEFIAQGSIIWNFENPDMVLIGQGDEKAGEALEEVYHAICHNKPVIARMSVASAEITKLSLNCFVTMKIAYANQIGDIADRTPNASKLDILKAVGADVRVGHKCILPGYGYGGPCFPRDNRALGNYARMIGLNPILADATDASNVQHGKNQFDQLMKMDKAQYIFEQVAYKDNCPVNIIEESQKLVIAKMLAKAGKKVLIRDKDFIIKEVKQEFGDIFEYETVKEYKGFCELY